MLNKSSILITGGTGSFGHEFIKMTLKKFSPKKIIIFSRDEMKQWHMKETMQNNKLLRFIIGDVRDKERLYRAINGVDYVIHAAATKIVPTAEHDPFECIKTNVIGAMNVVDACLDNKVKKVIALSTDKASNPINLYGASKLASDKIFVASKTYIGNNKTKFAVVRYGNVMGSRGSVIPFFISKSNEKYLPVTDKRMTRFMISLEDAVKLVWHSFEIMFGGEIFVKKIPSMNILDIAKSVSPDSKIKLIGIRPGEKLHEQMIGEDDARYTYEYSDYFKILPNYVMESKLKKRIVGKGKKVKENFIYSSETNNDWMTIKELSSWLKENQKNFLKSK